MISKHACGFVLFNEKCLNLCENRVIKLNEKVLTDYVKNYLIKQLTCSVHFPRTCVYLLIGWGIMVRK